MSNTIDNTSQNNEAQNRLLKLYELTSQRIIHEHNLIWSRFKVYLSLITGTILLLGFFLKDCVKNQIYPHWTILLTITFICWIAFLLSWAWEKVNKDGEYWQKVLRDNLSKIEKNLSVNDLGFYSISMSIHETDKKRVDTVRVNIFVARFSKIRWFVLGLLSSFLLIIKVLH